MWGREIMGEAMEDEKGVLEAGWKKRTWLRLRGTWKVHLVVPILSPQQTLLS